LITIGVYPRAMAPGAQLRSGGDSQFRIGIGFAGRVPEASDWRWRSLPPMPTGRKTGRPIGVRT